MDIKPTPTQNLIRDGETDIYYARVKIKGRVYVRSLETKTATSAKLRLPDKLKEIRESVPTEGTTGLLELKATFADAASVYTNEVNAESRLADGTKEARLRPLAALRRTWPVLFGMEIRHISAAAIKAYMADFELGKWPYRPTNSKIKTVAGNSPSSVNKMTACLKNIFEIAVNAHVIAKNPAAELKHMPPRKKLLQLPNKSQFAQLITHVRTKTGRGRITGDFIEGLSFSGLRLEEAGTLKWHDLDHERGMIIVRGTKTAGSARVIPMTNAFAALTLQMKAHREKLKNKQPAPETKVFEASEASTTLVKACAAMGLKKLTHHDLRHLFATTCIESGVDIPTVAGWLGHADGGALAMKTYGHIRPAHSIEAAKKVQFS